MTEQHPPTSGTFMPIDPFPLVSETFDRGQVTDLRHSVASCAEASGLTGQRLDDLVLAVNELLTNAVRHGGGRGSLRMWRANGAVVCEVSDHGGGIDPDRLADPRRPAPEVGGGWGLWLTRKLSDDLVVRTSPAGTTVQISMKIVRTDSMDGHGRGGHRQAGDGRADAVD